MAKLSKVLLENIDRLMKAQRINQTGLADKLGVSSPNISRFLADQQSNPKLEKLEAIAEALGTDPWKLIRPEEESIPQAKRELLALIRGMDENESAWALEALDVLLRGLRGQPLRPDQPTKKVKDR